MDKCCVYALLVGLIVRIRVFFALIAQFFETMNRGALR